MATNKRIYLCLAHMSDTGMEQKYILDNFSTETFDFVNYAHLSERESRAIWEGRNHPDVKMLALV